MSAARRSRTVLAIGIAVGVLAGCGTSSTSSGVPDSKIIAALDMKKVQGRYAIEANPFCSVSQLLNSADQVDKAKSSHRVIASRDATVGIEIVKPFAPSCQKQAQRKLNRLAGLRRHHRHKKKGKHGKEKGKHGKAAGHGGKHHHQKSKNGGGGSNGG